MLVLTRKNQESVIVGGSGVFPQQLTVTVLRISGDRVKLGFDVDAAVPVHRQEIWERMQSTGEQAKSVGAAADSSDPVPPASSD